MKGCLCATCEGQRAYARRPDVKERHAAEHRRYLLSLTAAEFAHRRAADRDRKRDYADKRDQERINHLRRLG